ncbi:MAG TPA: helix-turn-helix transcriptional regulator [Candidatus Sulfotelmatobacter sp.]|nr:helix-turn-helix transcriptional regulator [Candidatus Sulfotelmatobacter sp.]
MRVWQTIRTPILGRHVHERAYAALVLSGSYEEAGDSGRHRVQAGDVVLHEAFEAHLDRFPASGAVILNLSFRSQYAFRSGIARVNDPDAIVRLVEKGDWEAAALLLWSAETKHPDIQDWPDELATSLVQNASVNLSDWSGAKGIPPWDLSRSFARVFGISPSSFRATARTRQAWRAIRTTDTPLSAIAADCGFADQAHMTRSVKTMTGRCPSAWRSARK